MGHLGKLQKYCLLSTAVEYQAFPLQIARKKEWELAVYLKGLNSDFSRSSLNEEED